MRIRSIVAIVTLMGAVTAAGCNGPTKAGIENRQAAEGDAERC